MRLSRHFLGRGAVLRVGRCGLGRGRIVGGLRVRCGGRLGRRRVGGGRRIGGLRIRGSGVGGLLAGARLREAEADDYRFEAVVMGVVASPAFRMRTKAGSE